jgi:trehalose 6-phosphate synthase/phosphatase
MMAQRKTQSSSHSRLIVVSNRLPVTIRRGPRGPESYRSTGGLVAAFEPTLEARGGVWIGWPGAEFRDDESLSQPGDPYDIVPVHISRTELKHYYYGFANRTLWPLFHSLPTQTVFHLSDWQSYLDVNDRFAEATASQTKRGDMVWVNDYHLFLTPSLLRARHTDLAIGFFLHIPFPPYDIFRLLPWATDVLVGLLGSDLIGFHVKGYVRNFLECAKRHLGAQVDRRRGIVEFEGGRSRVAAFPLGIDFEHFESLALSAPPAAETGERMVLGVDRLDYTKGIPHRIHAFARLLDKHPEHRQKATLLQVAVPSRSEVAEYRQLKREIDELVGRVNGRFATATWSPIRYLYRSIPQERLAALYRDADVALITPLRDGMNLVAKEFVVCQVDEPGVLILSMLAGAAETMREAVLVNPYDVEGTAESLHRALTMPTAERLERMNALRARERASNVHVWAKGFLDRLTQRRRAQHLQETVTSR